MVEYRAINLIVKNGGALAALAGIVVTALGISVTLDLVSTPVWIIASIVFGAIAAFFVLLLRDIAKVIADTLIPLP